MNDLRHRAPVYRAPVHRAPVHRAGLSMVEVTISTALVGLMLVASLNAVSGAAMTSRIGAEADDGRTLAHELMAEILASPYEDPDDTASINFGAEADETALPLGRMAFDDVDDYDDWVESPPANRSGLVRTNANGWSRSVDVKKISWANVANDVNDNAPDQGIKRVTVTVTSPGGETTTLQAIRSKYGSIEQTLSVDTDVVTSVFVELNAGTGDVVHHGGHLTNHASGP